MTPHIPTLPPVTDEERAAADWRAANVWVPALNRMRAEYAAIGDEREGPDESELLTGEAYWDEQERLAGMLNGEAA